MLFQVAANGFSACCCGGVNSVQAGFETTILVADLLADGFGAAVTTGDWENATIGARIRLKTASVLVR